MTDQQPETLSTATPPVDAAAPAPGSDETEGAVEKPSWWDRLRTFGRVSTVPETFDSTQAQTDQAAPAAPSTLVVSQEELDRRVQAETDRREAKRMREHREAERKRLRDEDPWAYAEQERTAEQQQQATTQIEQVFSTIGAEHDRHTLDPLTERLPRAERDRILAIEGAGLGLVGRRLIVDESLKSLEKQWKAEGAKDAETRLRRNPAFRKQVLAESRGQMVEPELLPAASGSSDVRVSDLLRQQIGLHRSA